MRRGPDVGEPTTTVDLEGMRASHAASQSRLDQWKRHFADASTDKRQANALAVQMRQCFNGTDGVAAHIDRGLLLEEVYRLRVEEQLKITERQGFNAWAQSYLDGGRWAGHRYDDAVRTEMLERDAQLAAVKADLARVTEERAQAAAKADRYGAAFNAVVISLGLDPAQYADEGDGLPAAKVMAIAERLLADCRVMADACREVSRIEGDASATDRPDYIASLVCAGAVARAALARAALARHATKGGGA